MLHVGRELYAIETVAHARFTEQNDNAMLISYVKYNNAWHHMNYLGYLASEYSWSINDLIRL